MGKGIIYTSNSSERVNKISSSENMANIPSMNGAIDALDTTNPLQMIAGITAVVQSLTRITIDWTNMQEGQGFYIRFYGEDGQLLCEFEAFGIFTNYLQVLADYLQSPWMATIIMVGTVLFMMGQMIYNQINETYF